MVDMFPSLTANHRLDGSVGEPDCIGNSRNALTAGMSQANISDDLGGKYGPRLSFTPDLSALGHHVCNIVLNRSKKEVIRVGTRWVVAAMQDLKPARNNANVDLPRDAMRTDGHSVNGECPVSLAIPSAGPQPAAHGLFCKAPKPDGNRFTVDSLSFPHRRTVFCSHVMDSAHRLGARFFRTTFDNANGRHSRRRSKHRQMLPSSSHDDVAQCLLRQAVFGGHRRPSFSGRSSRPDFHDIFSGNRSLWHKRRLPYNETNCKSGGGW